MDRTVGLTVELKLCFQIPPAQCGCGLRHVILFVFKAMPLETLNIINDCYSKLHPVIQ